jgi:hypothetical protein
LLTTLQARNPPQITTSTLSENTATTVAVIPIGDPILEPLTSQEQENEDLGDQLLAEMGTGSSQVVQVTDLMGGIQAAQPLATLAT